MCKNCEGICTCPNNIFLNPKIGITSSLNENINGVSKYLFKLNDLNNLVLSDNGDQTLNDFSFEARLISKELSNGKTSNGDISKIKVKFHRKAQDPQLTKLAPKVLNEDFNFYSLDNFVSITPYEDDSIVYIIDNFSDSLNIYDAQKKLIPKKKI